MKCATKYCKKTAKQGNFCYTCVKRKFATKYPEKYAFMVLRNNAKGRGKIFTITFEDFMSCVVRTKYMKNRGRTATSLHLDRKREELGYIPGNIQVLKNAANVRKFLSYAHDKNGKPTNFKTITQNDQSQTAGTEAEQYPF